MFKILKSPDGVQSTKDAIAEQSREAGSWASLHLICFHLQMEIQTITFTDSLKALRQYVYCQYHSVFHSYPSIKYEFNACIS